MSARDTALKALCACRTEEAWSDAALRRAIRKDGLDARDAALATELCCGVLQNRLLLDERIDRFARGKLQPVVREILRIAVYQITMLDRIPASAAVNEAVGQAKRYANERAAGLVNAVLRNLLRNRDRLELPESLSVRYSHPRPLTELLRESVGEEKLEALLAANNRTPPVYAQINETKSDCGSVLASLNREGADAAPHPFLPGCVTLRGRGVEQTEAFAEGAIFVQDPAARMAVLSAGLKPGMTVLDCCAAPGGKSFAAANEMKNEGQILSCDIYPHRVELIKQGAERLGFSCIRALVQDAAAERAEWNGSFDAVLADVPCSGLGVIRKKPEIRYKDLAPMVELPELQLRILRTQAARVKSGGVLIYSTCTLLKRENEAVAAAFLNEHPEFSPEDFTAANGKRSQGGCLTLLPCDDGTDGFFICKLRKRF